MFVKHQRFWSANQIRRPNLNLDSYINAQLTTDNFANHLAHRNDTISNIANHVNILIKFDYFVKFGYKKKIK